MHYLVESYLLLIECHTAAETLWQNNRTIICFSSFHWGRARRGQLCLCVSLRLNGYNTHSSGEWFTSTYASTLWCTHCMYPAYMDTPCQVGIWSWGFPLSGHSTFYQELIMTREGKNIRLTCLNIRKCIIRVLLDSVASHPNAFIHADSHA